PPTCARSRAVRVWVARGSMAYSAVIHPSPRPRRHDGTPSSTLAVHSTRVWPQVMKHEPSAYGDACRSIVIGRSASGARPVRADASAGATECLDDAGSRLPCGEWNDVHAPAPRLDLGASDDRVRRVVPALHEHVGTK